MSIELFVDCVRSCFCCGYRRDSHFGVVSYLEDETIPDDVQTIKRDDEYFIPVDDDDTCIYLVKENNGFTSCGIHDKRPRTCRLYSCLTEKKVKYLEVITDELREK